MSGNLLEICPLRLSRASPRRKIFVTAKRAALLGVVRVCKLAGCVRNAATQLRKSPHLFPAKDHLQSIAECPVVVFHFCVSKYMLFLFFWIIHCAHFIKGKVFIKRQINGLGRTGRRRRRLQLSRSVIGVDTRRHIRHTWGVGRSRRRLQVSGSAIDSNRV